MLALRDLLARDTSAKKTHFSAKAKSVIYLFMHGGPSQVDTFDPKPALKKLDGQAPPAEYHKLQFQFIEVQKQKMMASRQTFSRCGRASIDISDSLRQLQSCADDLCVLRGVHHEIFNH